MTELRVHLPDDVAARLADEAAQRGTSTEDLAGEVLVDRFPIRRKLSFASLGFSTSGQRAAEDEHLLADGFGC
jgi:hypothetical protein